MPSLIFRGRFWSSLVLALALGSPVVRAEEVSALHAALESIRAEALMRHVEVLADDTFEGREAGSRGGRAAAGYLAQQLQHRGLEPAGADGTWHQAFGAGYRNLLGRISGRDGSLGQEVILVGAHYDHVGYGSLINSYGPTGYIHNGADDNASGVASLLEMAAALRLLEEPPRRTILFALWDGEEKGLLGSRHWLAHPTVPPRQVLLAINLDMIGRLRDDRLEIGGTRTGFALRQLVSRQNHEGLSLEFAWRLESNSDHWPFYQRGIPVLMFHTGLHEDYHRPSDDAHKLNREGMERITRLVLRVVIQLAEADQVSGFRQAARQETSARRHVLERPLPPPPMRLGVVWDEDDRAAPGLRITRVMGRSPAETAGLRIGDRLIEWNDAEVESGRDLRRFVAMARGPVQVRISREGEPQPRTIQVELAGKPVRVGIAWREDDAEPGSVLITQVVPGSPADEAGLVVRDRIYALDGEPLADSEAFRREISRRSGPVELLIERKGRVESVELTLPPLADEEPEPRVGWAAPTNAPGRGRWAQSALQVERRSAVRSSSVGRGP